MEDRRRDTALTIEFALFLALAFGASFWLPLNGAALREAILLGTVALAAGFALAAARRLHGRAPAIWTLLGVAGLLWPGAESARLIVGRLAENSNEQWLVSGSVYFTAYGLLLVAGLYALASSSFMDWILGLLDTAMVALALTVPWLEFVVLARLDESGGWIVLPQLLLPAAALTLIVLALFALHVSPVTPVWGLPVVGALAAGLAGDLLAARHLLDGGALAAALGGWEGRALLLMIGAVLVGGYTSLRERRLLRPGVVRVAVLLAAFGATLVSSAYKFQRGDEVAGSAIVGVACFLLVSRFLLHAFKKQRVSEQLEQALREQEQLAVMDSLTGLYNRRFLDAALKLELDRGARSHEPVGLLLCDLDHFKRINDTHGHLIGDTVLREVSQRLLAAVRTGDIVARYGGEEFVVLLPGGGTGQLLEIGERCRSAFDRRAFALPGGYQAIVTISIGGASWPEDAASARELFEAADAALYRAKQAGRNRIYISGPAVEPNTLEHEEEEKTLAPVLVPEAAEPAVEAPVPASESALPAVPEGAGEVSLERVEGSESRRMALWAALVARALGLDEESQRRCALAARYHDVGKLGLPESILTKAGPLSQREWELVCTHPEGGATLVELVPGLAGVAQIIGEHHERYDGRGYPLGKRAGEISTEARIVSCCDAWEAMRRERSYATAKSVSEARAELLAGRGTQFDPDVVMTFLMFEESDLDAAELDEALVGSC
jgi:two-component system cell cycle response regulator